MADAKTWAFAIVVGLVLAGGVLVGLHVLSGEAAAQTAPDFTLETIRHGNFTLSEQRGSVVVLDLMAVDCPTCRVTEKSMLRLSEQHPDVVILSVDIWTHLEDEAYLDAHMQRLGADWAYGMDTADLLFRYNAFEISKVVVIDPQGRIAWSAVGALGYDRIERAVLDAQQGGTAPALLAKVPLGLTGFALAAGVASFFAPCAFPLLPGYMAYALSLKRRSADGEAAEPPRLRHALAPGLAAALGILLIYGLFGLTVAALGGTARPWLPFLQPSIGVLAIVLGVALLLGATMAGIVAPLQRAVDRLVRLVTKRSAPGSLTGYFSYGLGYGAAAAGCTAPVLLQLSLTAFVLGFATGLRVFLVYAGTAALLMIAATLVAVKARDRLQRHSVAIAQIANRLSGVILVLAGIYLLWFFHRAFGLPFLG